MEFGGITMRDSVRVCLLLRRSILEYISLSVRFYQSLFDVVKDGVFIGKFAKLLENS